MRAKRVLFLWINLLIAWSVAQEAQSVPALSQVTYAVNPVTESGLNVSGSIYIADYGLGNTSVVVVSAQGAEGNARPAHLHAGNCGSGGGIVVPLEPIDPETGMSITVTTAAYAEITTGNHYLNIYASAEDLGTIIACGEVGTGARGVANANESEAQSTTSTNTPPASAQSQTATGVKPEEFESQIPTASYGLFAVGDSGIAGQVQISGQVEGGTRIVVSLNGAEAGRRYPTELRSGDCGPDGAVLRRLNDFPLGVIDPGASETTTGLSFEEIAEADNYLSIYAADGSGTVIACGEVGLGANR